jgi:hypothetical protein
MNGMCALELSAQAPSFCAADTAFCAADAAFCAADAAFCAADAAFCAADTAFCAADTAFCASQFVANKIATQTAPDAINFRIVVLVFLMVPLGCCCCLLFHAHKVCAYYGLPKSIPAFDPLLPAPTRQFDPPL